MLCFGCTEADAIAMAPWAQIARPLGIHAAANCVKTVLGAGMVGYGVALAASPAVESDGVRDEGDSPRARLVRKCVAAAAAIGTGLFLSLPSLVSQVVWEVMLPGITAADIASDLATEEVTNILPKWRLNLSGLVPSREELSSLTSSALARQPTGSAH